MKVKLKCVVIEIYHKSVPGCENR